MKALATSLLIFIILSGLVSYIFKASFAVAPGVVAVAYLIGQILSFGSMHLTEHCINVAILASVLAALFIASHFFPILNEVGLYNVQIL